MLRLFSVQVYSVHARLTVCGISGRSFHLGGFAIAAPWQCRDFARTVHH